MRLNTYLSRLHKELEKTHEAVKKVEKSRAMLRKEMRTSREMNENPRVGASRKEIRRHDIDHHMENQDTSWEQRNIQRRYQEKVSQNKAAMQLVLERQQKLNNENELVSGLLQSRQGRVELSHLLRNSDWSVPCTPEQFLCIKNLHRKIAEVADEDKLVCKHKRGRSLIDSAASLIIAVTLASFAVFMLKVVGNPDNSSDWFMLILFCFLPGLVSVGSCLLAVLPQDNRFVMEFFNPGSSETAD